jgi:hypothetical protein
MFVFNTKKAIKLEKHCIHYAGFCILHHEIKISAREPVITICMISISVSEQNTAQTNEHILVSNPEHSVTRLQ